MIFPNYNLNKFQFKIILTLYFKVHAMIFTCALSQFTGIKYNGSTKGDKRTKLNETKIHRRWKKANSHSSVLINNENEQVE